MNPLNICSMDTEFKKKARSKKIEINRQEKNAIINESSKIRIQRDIN